MCGGQVPDDWGLVNEMGFFCHLQMATEVFQGFNGRPHLTDNPWWLVVGSDEVRRFNTGERVLELLQELEYHILCHELQL